ncbi:MAG: hypothetical protein JWQ71_4585 [Pedosphaera sp.]|nr:hypothetical protein [Pedosphaera sp.]
MISAVSLDRLPLQTLQTWNSTNIMRIPTSLLLLSASLLLITGCSSTKNGSGKWETLFDGKSVDHWRGYQRDAFPSKGWTVENGTLKTIPGGDIVDLVTKDNYESFELQLEWRISPAGNSGVMYHVVEGFKEPWYTGPEMQVLDDAKHNDGQNPKTSAGALYALIAPINKHLKPVGEWNQARLLVNGNHVEHWLNGNKVVQYELNSDELNQLIVNSKFKDKPRFAKEKTGHVVLQNHKDEVWYRNIKIRRL